MKKLALSITAIAVISFSGICQAQERMDNYRLTEMDVQIIFMALQRAPIANEWTAPILNRLQSQYQEGHRALAGSILTPPKASDPPPAAMTPPASKPLEEQKSKK